MPRVGVVVFVRPDWGDLAMRYGSYWLSLLVDEARRLGWDVTDLYGDEATREKIEETLETVDPLFFHAVGHGDVNVYTAQRKEVVFVACENDDLLAGRVTYLLSCKTGAVLGPSIVNKGGTAYLGYRDVFGWIVKEPHDPATDEYARAFMELTNTIASALLRGRTAREAYDAGIATADRWIDYWSRSDDPNAPEIIKWLAHDRDVLVLYGAGGVRVTRPITPAIAWQLPMVIGLGSMLFTR